MEKIVHSETGLEMVKSASECETSFVVADFEGEVFMKLRRAQVRIIGPTVLHHCAQQDLVQIVI